MKTSYLKIIKPCTKTTHLRAYSLIGLVASSLLISACSNQNSESGCSDSTIKTTCKEDVFNWSVLDTKNKTPLPLSINSDAHFDSLVNPDNQAPVAITSTTNKLVVAYSNSDVLKIVDTQSLITKSSDSFAISTHNKYIDLKNLFFEDIKSTSDTQTIAAIVNRAADNRASNKGLGLYIAQAPSDTEKNLTNNYGYTNSYYEYPQILAYDINPHFIAVADKIGKIQLLHHNRELATEHYIKYEVHDLLLSANGKYLYVAGKQMMGFFTSEGIVTKFAIKKSADSVALEKLWEWKQASVIEKIEEFDELKIIAQPQDEEAVYVLGTFTNNEHKVKYKTITLSTAPKSIATNYDFTLDTSEDQNNLFAVSYDKKIAIFDINSNFYENSLNSKAVDISFANSDTLLATTDKSLLSISIKSE